MPSVLLVCADDHRPIYAEHFCAQGLIVCEAADPAAAQQRVLAEPPPDVVIADSTFPGSPIDAIGLIHDLRLRLDDATSIIVIAAAAHAEDRASLRLAGADLFVTPAAPSQVLFETKRALILRRSGRRLTWNWREDAVSVVRTSQRHAS